MKIPSINEKREDCCKVADDDVENEIPIACEKRRITDGRFVFVFISCLVLVVPILIHALIHSDVNRYNGYDRCGNICGQKNVEYEEWECTGQDMTSKSYYRYDIEDVEGCATVEEFDELRYHGNGKFFGNSEKNPSVKLQWLGLTVSLAYFVPLGISLVLALLLRYATSVTVVGILTACLLLPIPTLIYYGLMPLICIIVCGLILVIGLCGLVAKRDQIRLIIILLKESSKTILAIQPIRFNTAMTSVLSLLIIVTYSITNFHIETSGILTKISHNRLDYVPDGFMVITPYLSGITAFWMIQFAIGIGSVTSSAVIANRYFSRYEGNLRTCETVKYHSGTVAIVSLLSKVVVLPRAILMALLPITISKDFAWFCLSYIDGFFSKNVYIMTAMHGTAFINSGKEVLKFSKSGVGSTEFIHFFGDFVITLTQSLIAIGYTLIFYSAANYQPEHYFSCLVLFVISCISTEIVLGPFKVALSTLFFCISKDNSLQIEATQLHTLSKKEDLDIHYKFFADKIKEKWPSRNTEHIETI